MKFIRSLAIGLLALQVSQAAFADAAPGDTGKDRVLTYLATLDMVFGMTLGDRIAIGLDVAGYRTATGGGYGVRGRYGIGGQITRRTCLSRM